MKYLYLLAFCFFFGFNSRAQSFAEKGAVWHYTKHYSFSQSKSYVKVESVKDTVIQGKSCHELSLIGGYLCNYYQSTIFVYQKDSVVYFSTGESIQFETLYDFTTKKDSSWTIKYRRSFQSYYDSVQVRVDSIGKKEINGQNLKLLYVTYFNNTSIPGGARQSKIVEKIGDINYLFNWFICFDGQVAYGLRCYRAPSFGVYTTWVAPSCIATSVQEYGDNQSIKMYPNPVNSILHIELNSNTNFQIMDLGGREMLNGKLEKDNAIINLEILKSGIYILRMEQNGEYQNYKIQKL